MKYLDILAFAAVGSAFVVPSEQVLGELALQRPQREEHRAKPNLLKKLEKVPCGAHHLVEDAQSKWRGAKKASKSILDETLSFLDNAGKEANDKFMVHGFDAKAWLDTNIESKLEAFENPDAEHPHPPHKKPPHHGPGKHKPHHPPHHGKPNSTIYELISKSKYTTKLAKIIDEDSELVELLNSTEANFTLFAPTDAAFEKIPHHGGKPPKEFIKKVLLYHISPGLYPAGKLLFSHTVPTLLNETLLGDKSQRLAAKLRFGGVFINSYSKVVAVNIPATNGLIHGLASILIPPPKALRILSFLPTEFSTLLLGLEKTGLTTVLNTTSTSTVGGTFFAPPNGAFKKLGPRINAFLFSPMGTKYLKALLEYHVVANETLYSNAYYGPESTEALVKGNQAEADAVPYFHFDLPTLLEDKTLAVDVSRVGPFISMKINAFVRVVVQDGIAKDGVIQVVNNVLIPPKKLGEKDVNGEEVMSYWNGEEMDVEDFVERLEPFVSRQSDKALWKLDL